MLHQMRRRHEVKNVHGNAESQSAGLQNSQATESPILQSRLLFSKPPVLPSCPLTLSKRKVSFSALLPVIFRFQIGRKV